MLFSSVHTVRTVLLTVRKSVLASNLVTTTFHGGGGLVRLPVPGGSEDGTGLQVDPPWSHESEPDSRALGVMAPWRRLGALPLSGSWALPQPLRPTLGQSRPSVSSVAQREQRGCLPHKKKPRAAAPSLQALRAACAGERPAGSGPGRHDHAGRWQCRGMPLCHWQWAGGRVRPPAA
jgi:hypothetical protein